MIKKTKKKDLNKKSLKEKKTLSGNKKNRSAKKKTKKNDKHHLDKFGKVKKNFILEHIKAIDYNDLAKLINVKSADLKKEVENMGIKLPLESARKWEDIDLGHFVSLSDCARCQVQCNHRSFYVGINECRNCYEKNIKYWIKKEDLINITLKIEE